MDDTQGPKKKKLAGLIILGGLWIISSLGHMRALSDYAWYKYCVGHQYLPSALIPVRYFISWAQRFLGLTVGIGLVAHRRWAARTAVFLSAFDILAVYWRYPYQAFKNQSVVWDQRFGGMTAKFGYPDIHFSSYVLQAVVLTCVLDVAFFSFVLYYLTRPYVKQRLV